MTIDDLINEIITCDSLSDLQNSLSDLISNVNQPSTVDRFEEPARHVLSHLNTVNGTRLKAIGKIAQRLSEGYSVSDLKRVIDVKCDEWAGNKKMSGYLHPQTLFRSRNQVDKYLDQVKLVDNFTKKEVAKTKPDTIVLPKDLLEWN